MGGAQASKTLLNIQLKNREVSEEEKQELLQRIQKRYDDTMNPRYAASRLWVDDIIDPRRTREILSRSLACAAYNDQIPPFRTGVLQT